MILGIVSLVLIVGLSRSIVDHWQKGGIISERQQALEREEARNRELQAKLEEATSSAFIEKEAREKLGLVKEGDTVVLIDRTENSELNDQAKTEDLPNWKKWWKLFF